MPVFQILSLLFSLPFSPVTQLFRYLFFRYLFPRDPEKERKKRNSKPQLAVWDRLCECNHTAKIVDCVRQTMWVQWLCETATIVDSVNAITQPKLLTVWRLWVCETATIVDSVSAITQPKLLTVWGLWLCETARDSHNCWLCETDCLSAVLCVFFVFLYLSKYCI